jgi:hypothetical protein
VPDLRITQPGWGLYREPFFRRSRVCPTLLMACERLPRTGIVRRKRTRGIRVVLIGFSPAGCTSI